MAADVREVMDEAGERREARRSFWSSVGTFLTPVVAATWIAIVVAWTINLWSMLRNAAPVLDMFEADAGRPLTSDEWLMHKEAREIFCWHEGADPALNRIGRHIDVGFVYGPALAVGGMITGVTGAFIALVVIASETRRWAWLLRAMFVAALFSVLPLMLHWADIGALTQITE